MRVSAVWVNRLHTLVTIWGRDRVHDPGKLQRAEGWSILVVASSGMFSSRTEFTVDLCRQQPDLVLNELRGSVTLNLDDQLL